MSPVSIITCCVGVISCIIGVSTFISAQLSRAKQDGVLVEKVDYLVRGFDELKQERKEHDTSQDATIADHAIAIENLSTRLKNVEKVVYKSG